MARPLRIYVPGAWYHVTARGNERRDIFRTTPIDNLWLNWERWWRSTRSASMLRLTNNHYQFDPGTERRELSRAMQWSNVSHSQWCNRRSGRSGHLLQGRFKSIVVEVSGGDGTEPLRAPESDPDGRARFGQEPGEAGGGEWAKPCTAGRAVVLSTCGPSAGVPYPAYVGWASVPERSHL